jgi:hypothetical protein
MRGLALVLLLLIVAAGPCSDRGTNNLSPAEDEFLGALEGVLSATRIRRSLDDSSDTPLLENATLRGLYSRSSDNENATRSIVQDPGVGEEAKHLAVLTMQCLPLDSYVELLRFLHDQVRAGLCSEALLADAVFPGEQWGTVIAEHYRDPQVANLLKEILADARTSKLRDRVESVLDGDAARYIDHLRETGGEAPVWACENRSE